MFVKFKFHAWSKEYLIEEAVDDGEMFSGVGSKDSSCGIFASYIESSWKVPQGI